LQLTDYKQFTVSPLWWSCYDYEDDRRFLVKIINLSSRWRHVCARFNVYSRTRL